MLAIAVFDFCCAGALAAGGTITIPGGMLSGCSAVGAVGAAASAVCAQRARARARVSTEESLKVKCRVGK